MSAVVALLDSRSAVTTLRRARARHADGPVVSCRSMGGVLRVLADRVVDVVVLGLESLQQSDPSPLSVWYPAIPVVIYSRVRSSDADRLLSLRHAGVAGVLVEGVDDPLVGPLIGRHSMTGQRIEALAAAPRQLRLSDPIQLSVWRTLIESGGGPVRIQDLADRLGISREYLSRQFAAGGAPNLKRVVDLTRVCCASQLLVNPGYDHAEVARLLAFASTSHLSAVTRRITGGRVGHLGALGPAGVLARFIRVGTRSRLRRTTP